VCVCILALVILHANHIFSASHYIVIFGLSDRTIFGLSDTTIFFHVISKTLLNLKQIFSINLSETFLILRGIQRDIAINVHKSSCKVLVILFRF